MIKQIENGRAAYAYEQVKNFCVKPQSVQKEYRSLVRSLPSMIQTNGYAAVIAFLYAKKNGSVAHEAIYRTIDEWMQKQGILSSGNHELIEAITQQTRDGYKRMTWETMSLLDWIKRFAEGMIEVE
ncbi:type III-B CRISPR module-associated protein Cmr5 [Paenibacillus hunanensis]|uniref:CRISPR type III-B/RAMP module-associated protein Cmr5 n=1 Tax=Paenibacillus hunanensis TaxID=539262 RepID=A0ABU1IV04_9BACL|nr:type III-B CRISPR module-associated protein Cmr5 [Paenibacillus hunanensis]MDR6242746.1 CRISPR-associated protein Cmr5 [Paenibacillus hunanensis]GGJ02410.1 type III-B CRISPR module-associated protein Cmr5 [Paenibacillus hunanensis]